MDIIFTLPIFLTFLGLIYFSLKYFDRKQAERKEHLLNNAPNRFLSVLDKISRSGVRYVGKTAQVIYFRYEGEPEHDGYSYQNICLTESKKWFVHEFKYYLREENRIFEERVSPADEEWVKGELSINRELYIKYFGEPELA